MLHEFLDANRTELIARCAAKAAARFLPVEPAATVEQGVPIFLEKLVHVLRREQLTPNRPKTYVQPASNPTAIGVDAALHGADLRRRGFTVDQVVHGYGDVCQSVTEMAVEQDADISADEFRTLNRCLDDAIADAVTSYGSARDAQEAATLDEDLSSVSERRLINTALHAYSALKTGSVGLHGATGTLLLHVLQELQLLSERTAPEIPRRRGTPPPS